MITLTTEQAQQIEEALVFIPALMSDSKGVAGYHLNGEIADWDEFDDEVNTVHQALTTIRAARAQDQAEQEPRKLLHTGSGPWHLDSETAKFLADTINAGDEPTEITLRLGFICYDDGTVQYGLMVEESEHPEEGATLLAGCNPLNAAPVRTKDLTDDEIEWLVVDTLETWNSKDTMKDFARAVIAADREKNK